MPDDASDAEFNRFDTMLEAYWGGIRPTGYLGVGDTLTMKVRARIDNLPSEDQMKTRFPADTTYQDKVNNIQTWRGGSSTVHITLHDSQMNWLDANYNGNGWRHRFANGSTGAKPAHLLQPAPDPDPDPFTIHPYAFALQDTNRWRIDAADRAQDHEASFDQNTGALIPAEDYDADGDMTDTYLTATSGSFKIWCPSSSVRGDTFALRSLVTDQDFAVSLANDAFWRSDNQFYITQAVNTGGAVNSFIMDWQLPYYATQNSSIYDTPYQLNTAPVWRIRKQNVQTVLPGVWEVKGAEYNADGSPANDLARQAEDLRLYVWARVVSTDITNKNSVYFEQNGPSNNVYENYALPGTDADRDYFYGEDDFTKPDGSLAYGPDGELVSTDFNTADNVNKTVNVRDPNSSWVLLAVYKATDEDNNNHPIDVSYLTSGQQDIRQIRWVVKAVDSHGAAAAADPVSPGDQLGTATADTNLRQMPDTYRSYEKTVPHGLRLKVDAMPDDPSSPITVAATEGSQEADELDPDRLNVGWEAVKTPDGLDYERTHAGKYQLALQAVMPESLRQNAAGVRCQVNVDTRKPINEGGLLDPGTGSDLEASETPSVHLNHYLSGVLRYDDTKFVEVERQRVGFYRVHEKPALMLTMEEAYFGGTKTSGYEWRTGAPSLNLSNSRMMRYKLVLTNLDQAMLNTLNLTNIEPDTCTNPDMSILFPVLEDFGAANLLSNGSLTYVPYKDVLATDAGGAATSPLNLKYRSDPVLVEVEKTVPGTDITYTTWEVDPDHPASNIDNVTPMWTYHIENRTGTFQTAKRTEVVTTTNPDGTITTETIVTDEDDIFDLDPTDPTRMHALTLADPQVRPATDPEGPGSLLAEDKMRDLFSGADAKYMSWHFTGHELDDGTLDSAALNPGQAIVLEIMMPIRENAGPWMPIDQLQTVGFGYKEGNYEPYLPENTELVSTNYVYDTRDWNLDGDPNEMLMQVKLPGLAFATVDVHSQAKASSSDLGSEYTRTVQGPVGVPEGGNYTYRAQAINRGMDDNMSPNYKHGILFDILPYENDVHVANGDGSNPTNRRSTWNGWINDLNSIKLTMADPTGSQGGDRELGPAEAQLWIGPFDFDATTDVVVPLEEDALPQIWSLRNDVNKLSYMNERHVNIGTNAEQKMRESHFVKLDELKAYCGRHPEQAEKLRKAARGIWAEIISEPLYLPKVGNFQLTYEMHAPLNLPKYLGSTNGQASVDMSEAVSGGLAVRLAQVTQWNSFAQRINQKSGSNADRTAFLLEDPEAGAYIDAPSQRGYVGDYVWVDTNWNELQDDVNTSVSGTTTDDLGRTTAYHRGDNGRFLLSTDKTFDEDGNWLGNFQDADGNKVETRSALIDLNYDGKAEDPGVNGVKVELLNQYDQPVNREGQVAKWLQHPESGIWRWVLNDSEGTGPVLTETGAGWIAAEAGAPLSYTTESDYYGNQGYWILSNINPAAVNEKGEPVQYKLRYTFPYDYSAYAITTKLIGPDRDNKLIIERIEDDPTTPQNEAALVATTSEPIELKVLEYDEEEFKNLDHEDIFMNPDPVHRQYDARATSYDVGIARPLTYDGTVFRDDMLEEVQPGFEFADGTDLDYDYIDGYLDHQQNYGNNAAAIKTFREQRLGGMRVSVHRYNAVTQTVDQNPALDVDGEPAVLDTLSDGEFRFRLQPGYQYVVRCTDTVTSRFLKPTPYLFTQDPLAEPSAAQPLYDNDVYISNRGGLNYFETHPFPARVPLDAAHHAVYENNESWRGYKIYDKLALGFVDGARGFLGNKIWEDDDYNGQQSEASDVGVEGVKVTAEQYWWNPNGAGEGVGAWQLVEKQFPFEVTNRAGVYVFKGLPTYVYDPLDTEEGKPDELKQRFLAGYRLRIDNEALAALPDVYSFTLRSNSFTATGSLDEETDSDACSVELAGPDDGAFGSGAAATKLVHYFNEPTRYNGLELSSGLFADSMIVLAGLALPGITDEANVVQVKVPGGATYSFDLTNAQRYDNWDAGLVRVPTAGVTGRVWHDADYDGVQAKDASGAWSSAEPGLAGEAVLLTQWYYEPLRTNPDDHNSHWFRNESFGLDQRTSGIAGAVAFDAATATADGVDANGLLPGEIMTRTDAGGVYRFADLPTAWTDDTGHQRLAAYRVQLVALHVDDKGTPDPEDDNHWLPTRPHVGSGAAAIAVDSDLVDANGLTLTDREMVGSTTADRPLSGQIILARRIGTARVGQASQVTVAAGQCAGSAAAFDWLQVRDDAFRTDGKLWVAGGDAGQLPRPTAAIEGYLWEDPDNDGIHSSDEQGVSSIRVTLERYVPDPLNIDGDGDGWRRDESWHEDWQNDPTYALYNSGTDPDAPEVSAWEAYDRYPQHGIGSEYAGHSQRTDAAGHFRFDNLATQRLEADGSTTVFAYRVRVTVSPDLRYTYLIAKYQQGNDYRIDSDLRFQDAYLMDAEGHEYDVLLNRSDSASHGDNVVMAAASNNPNQGFGAARTMFMARGASLASPRATLDFPYDLAKAANRSNNDGMVEDVVSAEIAGDLWYDVDHDGQLEADERPIANVRMKLVKWYLDLDNTTWVRLEDDEITYTDAAGHYSFGDQLVYMKMDPEDIAERYPDYEGDLAVRPFMMGYTIEAQQDDADGHGVGFVPITAAEEGPWETSSKVLEPSTGDASLDYDEDWYPIQWKSQNVAVESQMRAVDGRLVLANPAVEGSSEEHIFRGFDVSSIAPQLHMNGGFVPLQIEGVVWKDDNNGIREADEPGIGGVTVELRRYWYDPNWTAEDNEGGSGDEPAPSPDPGPTPGPGPEPTPDPDPDPQPTPDPDPDPTPDPEPTPDPDPDPTPELELEVDALMVGPFGNLYRMVAFAMNALADGREDDGGSTGVGADGGAAEVSDVSGAESGGSTDAGDGADGDADNPGGEGGTGDNPGGEQPPAPEAPKKGRWVYDPTFDEYGVDAASARGLRTATSDGNGLWRFERLESTGVVTVDGVATPVVYGYRVNIPQIPAGYGVTVRDAEGYASRDSDLDQMNTRVVPDSPVGGVIVLADSYRGEPGEGEVMADGLGDQSWSARWTRSSYANDAGLVPYQRAVIGGRAWDDQNRNGIQEEGEETIPKVKVRLERITVDQQQAVEGLEWLGTTLTDGAPGSNLDAVGEPLVPATRMGVLPPVAPDTPENPGTDPDDPGTDPDNPGTDPDNPGTDPVTPGGDPDAGGDNSGGDADADNGDDDGEGGNGAVTSPEDETYNPQWVMVAETETDAEGNYQFAGLPLASEDGKPYVYRVRVVRPQDAYYVPALQGDNRNLDSDIVPVGNDPAAVEALTADYSVGTIIPEGVNAYGQLMAQTHAESWVRETGRAVDMGFAFDPDLLDIPGLRKLFPKLGDGALIFGLLALMVAAGAALELSRRRKKAEPGVPLKPPTES